MRSRLFGLWLAVLPVVTVSAGEEAPNVARFNVGTAVSVETIRSSDTSILPNGAGLPDGEGTVQQGKAIYAAQCAACHGDHSEGRADFVALVGGRGTLQNPKPLLTIGSYWPYATTIFDYIRRAMPYSAPGTLTSDEVYAVTAWLLEANEIIEDDVVLNKRTLANVKMPNRDGFVSDPRPDVSTPR
jgi:cytochrome c